MKTKSLIEMIFETINESQHAEIYDVWTDGDMILTSDKRMFSKMVDVFDMMELDFSTGTPTEDGEYYYLCFV